jgi:outer membrane protein assembly factor BamE (lipoprotein component of BamABCDE complex)
LSFWDLILIIYFDDRMTEEDIMWQLQQMAEAEVAEGGEEKEEEYNEDDIQQQLQLQHQEEQQQENEEKKEEPAAAAGTAAVNEKPKLSEEECIQKFNELLEERNISPFAVYSAEFPQLMTDPRFSCEFFIL